MPVFGCPVIIKLELLNQLEWDSEFRYGTFVVMSIPRKCLTYFYNLSNWNQGGITEKQKSSLIHLNYLTGKIGLRKISKFILLSCLKDPCQNSMMRATYNFLFWIMKHFMHFEKFRIWDNRHPNTDHPDLTDANILLNLFQILFIKIKIKYFTWSWSLNSIFPLSYTLEVTTLLNVQKYCFVFDYISMHPWKCIILCVIKFLPNWYHFYKFLHTIHL